MLVTVRWNCVEMSGDDDSSKVETHQNFDDSNVFTKDKRVSINVKSIWVFFMSWLSSKSFMQSHESVKSFTLLNICYLSINFNISKNSFISQVLKESKYLYYFLILLIWSIIKVRVFKHYLILIKAVYNVEIND